MSTSHRYTREQIDKLVFKVSSLDQGQREVVRDHLHAMHDRNDGMFYKESFKHELIELLNSNQISQTDFDGLKRAFFG